MALFLQLEARGFKTIARYDYQKWWQTLWPYEYHNKINFHLSYINAIIKIKQNYLKQI